MGGSFFFLFSSFRLDSFLRFTSCIFQFKLCVILIVFSFPRASSRTNSRSLKPNRVQSFHGECSCRLRLFSIEPRNKRPLTSRFWRFSFAEIFSLFEKTVVFLPPPPRSLHPFFDKRKLSSWKFLVSEWNYQITLLFNPSCLFVCDIFLWFFFSFRLLGKI